MEINIGVVFELDKKTREQSIKLSQNIGRKLGAVNLLGSENIPHITLFQGRFPSRNIEKIYQYIESLQNTYSPIDIFLTTDLLVRQNLNVFWMVTKSPQMMLLHFEIAKRLFPLTENLLMEQFALLLNSPTITISEKERLKSYGMLLSGDDFLPHVTLCKLNNSKNKSKLDMMDIPQSSFQSNCITIGELGFYGNLLKVLHKVRLIER